MTEAGKRGAAEYPLLSALRERRSRRFGLGMAMSTGPLAHTSAHPPLPLSEEEEALLAFAACGVTGHALADLLYAAGEGGTILAALAGRTIPSGDAICTVAVVLTNDEGAWLLRRPQDFAPGEIEDLARLAEAGDYLEHFRRSRVKLKDGRIAPRLDPLHNLQVNQWSLYAAGGAYLLPIADLTFLYINGVMEIFGEDTGAFIVDERAAFRPAGIARFGRSRGGCLDDDPRAGKTLTIQGVESLVTEFVSIEMGAALQNVGLMAQAMGLGGFPHWAAHPTGWLEELGFRMETMPASRYLGMNRLLGAGARLLGRDMPVKYAVGLEQNGQPLMRAWCPPYFATMAEAVRAVVEFKFGPEGTFRGGARHSAWADPDAIAAEAPAPSQAQIEATIAYCEYVFARYGRFPAYQPPFRTVLGCQVTHVDTDFYDRHYRPEALSPTQRAHLSLWHP